MRQQPGTGRDVVPEVGRAKAIRPSRFENSECLAEVRQGVREVLQDIIRYAHFKNLVRVGHGNSVVEMSLANVGIAQHFRRDIQGGNSSDVGQKLGGEVSRAGANFENMTFPLKARLAHLMENLRASYERRLAEIIALEKGLRAREPSRRLSASLKPGYELAPAVLTAIEPSDFSRTPACAEIRPSARATTSETASRNSSPRRFISSSSASEARSRSR